jgi:hypothetical protein
MKSRKAVRLFPKLEIGEFYESYWRISILIHVLNVNSVIFLC